MKLSSELRAKVKQLYDQGRYLQAYYASREAGPLWRWTDTDDRVLAGRLAGNLGAERLASLLHRLALRADPAHWDARYFSLWAISRRRGLLDAWELHRRWGEPVNETPEFRADWHAQRARFASWFRDFSEARAELDRAMKLAPERPWIWVEAGDLAAAEDRPDDAASAYRKALELRSWYRPAVQALGHSLIQANRLDEAQELLESASHELESGDVLAILAAIYEERDRHEAALEIWQKLPDYYPLLEFDRRRQQWLQANLADAYYACGDYAAAADCAEKSKSPFHVAIAERLRQPPDDRRQRVVLPVGFTLQHHLTCAPATLTTLSRFWGRPAAHLDVVEAICYDGTPAASERKWAVDQGYVAREFKVTWEVATRLIDAGIPFTLTTIDPGSGHLQAVIGYDRYRETLLMRDPNSRVIGECRGQALLEHYRPTGPRGMVMIPPDRSQLLDGVELPEAELYDETFTIEMALRRHDRETANAAVERLQQSAPDHRLTLHAVRALARYDGNLLSTFAAIEKLVTQFPDDVNLLLGHLGGLREQGRRDERLRILREHSEKPTVDPLIREAYARELSLDHRLIDEAAAHVRKVLRLRALSGSALSLLADITWAQRDFPTALSYYRLAACVDDKDEELAKSYFQAARNQGRTNEALAFIQDRAARYERRSTAPSRTVVWALEQFDRTQEAAQVIERAIAAHPEDGEFLLFAARFSATYGDLRRAAERLETARSRVSRGEWLRASAYLSRISGELHKALEAWKELLEREPLAPDANEAVADLLGQLVGQDEAWRHVQEMAARFPFNYAVRSTQLERARNHSPQEAERVARELTALHPQDPWARRELVSALVDQRRFEEALVEAHGAIELDPNAAAGHFFLGMAHEELRHIDNARLAYRRALELSIDYLPPMSALVGLCETRADRVAELQFIADQLRLQVNYGDGVLHYRTLASRTLEPSEIAELMRAAWRSRPDLWQTWSGLVRQALDCGDIEEAQRVAEEAVRRFPLVPRLWLDLAQVQETLCDKDAQFTAIQRALEIAPSWTLALRLLADMQEARDDRTEAVKTLQRAIRHAPLDSDNHVALAELYWRSEKHDNALEQIERTVQLEPGDERAWQLLRSWAGERGQRERALAAARRLADERPREARSFVVLADTLDDFDETAEALAAIERALELNPTLENAHSLKAYLLSKLDRPDEALAACSPPVFGDSPPLSLRARAAQVQANRGEERDAIERVREITRLDPDFYWAWNQLAEWSDRIGDFETSLSAAEQMVRLSAERPTSHGYLADALLRMNRRDEAKLAFERAVNIAHDYLFAVRNLADLYLEDGDYWKLSRLLEKSATSLPPGLDVAYRIQIARALKNQDSIPPLIDELLGRPIDDEWTLNFAFRQLERLQLSTTIVGRLRQRVAAGDTPAAIVSCWGRWEACFPGTDFYSVAAGLQESPELFRTALLSWCEEIETYFKSHPLHELGRRFGEKLKTDTRTWLGVGHAFLMCNDYAAAAKWLGDAPSREDGSSFAVLLLACAQYGLHEYAYAKKLHRSACSRWPEDEYAKLHGLLIALDMALSGDLSHGASNFGRYSDFKAPPGARDWIAVFHTGALNQLRAILAYFGSLQDVPRFTYRMACDHAKWPAETLATSRFQNGLHHRFRVALARRARRPFDFIYWTIEDLIRRTNAQAATARGG